MLELMREIVGQKPEGMTLREIESAILGHPNCPRTDNLRGYISSVLAGSKDGQGERMFLAIRPGREGRYALRGAPKVFTIKLTFEARVETGLGRELVEQELRQWFQGCVEDGLTDLGDHNDLELNSGHVQAEVSKV